jgi:hypothetical protein
MRNIAEKGSLREQESAATPQPESGRLDFPSLFLPFFSGEKELPLRNTGSTARPTS